MAHDSASDPLFSVDGQVVLVSGASRGIGRAIARGFSERGAHVIITGRQQQTIQEAASETAVNATPVQGLVCDVADGDAIRNTVRQIIEKFGRIDTLVNVAGINQRKPAVEYTEEEFDRIVGVNLRGVFLMSQAVGKQMIQQQSGSQINIGSLNSQRPLTHLLPYAVSKAGVDHMTRALASEWGHCGVRVNTLAPGFIETDLTKKIWQDQRMESWRVSNTPQQRIGHPEDLIGTAIFLASDASIYLTGQIIYVDGGATAGRMWPFGD